jgi:hypothetical protein
MHRSFWIAIALLLLLSPIPARSEEWKTKLVLDGLSYFSFGDEQVFSIPVGTEIVFRFPDRPAAESIPVEIHPDDLNLPAVSLRKTGEAFQFGLAAPARGTLQLTKDGLATMSFDARIRVQLDHPTEPGMQEVSIRFTTEASSARSLDGARSIAVSGMRLHPNARAVQLVGTRSGQASDYPVAGAPISAVLSGVFDSLPELEASSR